MTSNEPMPPRVRRMIQVLLAQARESQRVKLEFIRVYGRDRGLWEYTHLGDHSDRIRKASRLREVRALGLKNGFRITNRIACKVT